MKVNANKQDVVNFIVKQLNEQAKNADVMSLFFDIEQDYSIALSECFEFSDEVPRDVRRRKCSLAIDRKPA